MSPQSALAHSAHPACEPTQVADHTPAATIVFDRLPIHDVAPFAPVVPIAALRLVSGQASTRVEAGAGIVSMPREVTAPPHGLRLTFRGRVAAVVTAAGLLLGAAAFLVHAVSAPAAPLSPSPAGSRATIVVQPGQTLWSIATGVAPTADPRATIQQIVDVNRLSGTAVYAGEQLRLPS